MSVVKMAGVSVVGTYEGLEKLSRKLLSVGFFEPMPLEIMLGGTPPKSKVKRFNDNPYDVSIERVKRLWDTAGINPPSDIGERSHIISPKEAEAFADEISAKLSEWDAWSERLRDDMAALQARTFISEALAESGHSLDELNNSSGIGYSVGPILKENWDRLREISSSSPIFVRALIKGYKRVLTLVIYPREYKNDARKLFDAVHFQEYSGSSITDGFQDIEAMKEKFNALKKESEDNKRAAARYIEDNRTRCEGLYLSICAMQRVYTLLQSRGEVSGLIALSGFIPENRIGEVRSLVSNEAPGAVIITESDDEIAKHTKIPTLLRNNFFVRSFQDIVNLYSMPAYGEFDPSPIVAFTFCLFFGLMFGDVGHGAALAAGAWWLQRKGIMSQVFAKVIGIAGVVSMFFGVLYGSVFGDEEIIKPLWVSPMHDTNNLIAISVVIGVVFLSTGLLLKLVSLHKKRDWSELFFSAEGLPGILFYWTACLAVLRMMSAAPFGGEVLGWIIGIVLAGLFIVILLGNYLASKFFDRHAENDEVVHVFSIFHAMLSFVSNTASFVRLAAFALNHAGLSAAVYMLADMVKNTPGGRITTIIVILLGNLLIIGLEGLIVFIQTLRLEYYEFFSKFFQGGGRAFSPITWKE